MAQGRTMQDLLADGQPAGIAALSNVVAFGALVDRVLNRNKELPGIAAFYGKSGVGKSKSADHAAKIYKAYYVEVKSLWTKKRLCQAILQEMGITPVGTIADMLDQICDQLSLSRRPLIIDEADYLVKKGYIEMVRDIYEGSQGTVIIIGEEDLYRDLKKWERMDNRILGWVKAEPCTLADCRILAPMYAEGVTIADDLLEDLHKKVLGCTRRVCVNLARMAEFAAARGADTLSTTTYTDTIYTGNPALGA